MIEALASCTLLLIDDEEANLDLLEALLTQDGYTHLVRCVDARLAMTEFDACRPDLVLLDLHMPHRNGLDILAEIGRRTPAGDYLPVLVLTADATASARERALAGGARDFVTKPFDAVEVCLRVRNLLETRLLHVHQRAARERAEAAERRAALLAEASRALAASLDGATALAQLARVISPAFADLCCFDITDPDYGVQAAIAHADAPSEHTLLAVLDRVRATVDRPRETGAARRLDATPAAAGRFDAAPYTSLPHPPLRSAPLRPLDTSPGAAPHWWSAAEPLIAESGFDVLREPVGGETASLGTLTLVRAAGRPSFDTNDRATARELAHRAALTLENARLIAETQQAVLARDQVLSVVAHDLRNPLTAIAANAELLRHQLTPRAPEKHRIMLDRIERIAQRTHAQVEDLLEIGRARGSLLALRPYAVSPRDFTEEADAMLRPLADARGITLSFEGPAGPAAVMADASRIVQVLSNLVGNALRFTPPGGSIVVSWRYLESEFIITVADTGPGIPVHELPHIFSAFWRNDASDRRGVGLGLLIARTIVEAHTGRIWLESPATGGAAFSFSLPLIRPDESSHNG